MWRKALSIEQLFDEANEACPSRNKASDGTIGDAAHASRSSDHNPWVIDDRGVGVVRAADVTHSPDHGVDGDVLVQRVAALLGKHPALGSGAYVIWEARIISTDRLSEGWRPYPGSNEHRAHFHISVATARAGYDSTARWGIFDQEDDMADAATQALLQQIAADAKTAAEQATRAREGSFRRDKRARQELNARLDAVVEATGKTARREQIAAIKALLEDNETEEVTP